MKISAITNTNMNFGMPWINLKSPDNDFEPNMLKQINHQSAAKKRDALALTNFIQNHSPNHYVYWKDGVINTLQAKHLNDPSRTICSDTPLRAYLNGAIIVPVTKLTGGINGALEKMSNLISKDNQKIDEFWNGININLSQEEPTGGNDDELESEYAE